MMSGDIFNGNLVRRVKDILYLDGDDEDDLISSYITAAQNFVKNAIGTDTNGFYADDQVAPLINMAVVSLAATYYQNRLALSDTQTYPIDMTVNSIIGQLRGIYNEFEERDSNATTDQPSQPSN